MGIEALTTLFMPVGLGGMGIGKDPFDKKKDSGGSAPSPAPLPEAPKPEASAENAQEQVRKRKASQTQTTFTDPLGVGGQADIVRKTLTGQ